MRLSAELRGGGAVPHSADEPYLQLIAYVREEILNHPGPLTQDCVSRAAGPLWQSIGSHLVALAYAEAAGLVHWAID